MKVATWNVNGIRAREAQFTTWIAEAAPDVLCLQEIKATRDQVPAALVDLPGYWNYWHGGPGGYSGVSIHLRKERFAEEPAFSHPTFDMEMRIVQAETPAATFTSVYIPNGGKDFNAKLVFLTEMVEYAAAMHRSAKPFVLTGDMNVALTDKDIHPSHNKPGTIGILPEERALLQGIIDHGLVDVARRLDPDNDRLFTWWPFWKAARQRNLGWRIDYIFASAPMAEHAGSCTVFTDVGGSDHAPVMATFTI